MATESGLKFKYDTLDTLYHHHLWANLTLFERCSGLSETQLKTTITGVFGSIYDTLQHIAYAERSYLHRLETGQMYQGPADERPPTVAELRDLMRQTGEGLIGVAHRFGPVDSVEINWDGTLRQVPCAILLTQAINHATEHRAQIMTMLTQIGVEPPEIDAWQYFDARER